MQPRLPDHPDSLHELHHLTQTRRIIEHEIGKLELDTGVRAEEERTVVAPHDDTVDDIVAADIFRMKLDTLARLARSRHQAYFARLDFTPDGIREALCTSVFLKVPLEAYP